MKVRIILTLSIIAVTCLCGKAQSISNVEMKVEGGMAVVTYNLESSVAYDFALSYSTDRGGTYTRCKSVSGDLHGQTTGTKQIIWDFGNDSVVFDTITFKVTIIPPVSMVFVQGGTFSMGCTSEQGSDCEDDEKPPHIVTLSDFYIGKYEVTQAQWQAIMGTTIRQQRDKDGKDSPLYGEGDSYPMYYVSWNEVQEFIKKLNAATGKQYRLPTEAEWEYAARGGNKSNGYKYSGSNTFEDVAWYGSNSGRETHPVGTKQPNELGIYDMSGNVWEWCNDWYGSYSSSSQRDPAGASSGSYRVIRGGGWYISAQGCRTSIRLYYSSDDRNVALGFRLVSSSK
jgi:formylglycine-generating enzyme required for sulfatase activity